MKTSLDAVYNLVGLYTVCLGRVLHRISTSFLMFDRSLQGISFQIIQFHIIFNSSPGLIFTMKDIHIF